VSNAAAFGGAYRTEHLPGAWVAYGFTGTSVTWYTVTGPGQGKADVYVDGVKKATVNNYASRTSYRVARTVSGLTAAKHQLRIVVTGVKGSTAGTGTYVSVDATRVGGTVTNNPTLANKWRTAAATGPSGGYLAQADLAGASASTTFRGTLVSFWTSTGKNRGIAKLYVDGVLKGTYDLYSATTAYNVRRTVTGLSDAVHTVKVVVTGTKRAAATGRLVCLDRWTIG
jgi:bacillopeptidase F